MELKDINNYFSPEKETESMPVLFIGHGSPMNGIEDNEFSQKWEQLGNELPKPSAILCISAHWLTQGTFITAMPNPRTIHDFGGFPKSLYDVQYSAPGDSNLANETKLLVNKTDIGLDHEWGLDHGTWSVVRRMYPNADIPVLQLSIDYHKSAQYHYDLAQELKSLRNKGVLIIGSGNMVHNLRMIAWDKMDIPEFGFDWALEMNELFKKNILNHHHKELIQFENMGNMAKLAIPTPDHYFPLLYALALQNKTDQITIFNDKAVAGSLTMTSVKIS
jgi:4,5-DOPA dioxygenase extradiol